MLEVQSRDFLIAGFLIGGVPIRKKPDRQAIIDSAVNYLKAPASLADLIKSEPLIEKNDNGVAVALKMIWFMAGGPKSKYSTWAKDFLRHIKRPDLLPRNPDGSPVKDTTDNIWLLFWKHEPEDLYELVKECEAALLEACPKPHKKGAGKPRCAPRGGKPPLYDCCIKRAFGLDTSEAISKHLSKYVPRRGTNITDITLLLISHKHSVPFPALKKRYTQITEKGEFLDPKEDKIDRILDRKSGFKVVEPQ